ncbi:putative tartrate:succinate antiporter [Klebsiella pneumoniae]|uniref:Putative tartrate:succinate antiporter n=1 Tax=Klebsiella pneumoniae TaxID=573 RepID=A0A377X7W1_KLEPN|nr:putative tartrate:succinate antiporter [Klebsiella pneumoniae]
MALADGLSSTGFIAWLGKEGGALMSGISPGMATIVLLLAFYLLHYLFASTTAPHHHAAAGHADHCLDYPGNEYGSVCPADGHLAWA